MGLVSKSAELASMPKPNKDVVCAERHDFMATGSFDVSQSAFLDKSALFRTLLGTSIWAFSRLDVFKGGALLSHNVVLLIYFHCRAVFWNSLLVLRMECDMPLTVGYLVLLELL